MGKSNFQKDNLFWEDLNLDYSGENNYASFFPSKSHTHAYPAKAVPDMVFEILNHLKMNYETKSVLDPFVGSGTTALEAKYLGLDFYGSDLNPLSILIARTKVLTLSNSNYTTKVIRNFVNNLQEEFNNTKIVKLDFFKNINYWFKEENIKELSFIKEKINRFLDEVEIENKKNYALILLNAFSSSVRASSLTRNSEFKLYRMSPRDLKEFEVNAIEIFSKNVIKLVDMLFEVNKEYKEDSTVQIELDNAKELAFMENKKIDLVLTSPPYGDSRSTVAYGQFSKLSLQWMSDLLAKYLDINVYSENCDEYLLGGKKSSYEIHDPLVLMESKTLRNLMNEMDGVIDIEIRNLDKMKSSLDFLQVMIANKEIITMEHIDPDIYELLRERVRLDFYRDINKTATLKRKDVKKQSEEKTDLFFKQLFDSEASKQLPMLEILQIKLKAVMATIKRKIRTVPKRKEEVLNFFKDLYQVVIATDKVLNQNGVQAWIVGHRTVLGKVNVNMKEILNDWFCEIGYEKITDLTREYSFKRLPHHINSTVNRNEQIKTMMQEYIIIVRKK
ncbi:hypothetical protein ABD91_14910 [Lysinibacillus sphaericus]|uniref:DNA methyltransferase n=1 Tax=Lysinibacillus sphaericus TaxID=1421 RepID=UPI0018CCE6D4|nr:DNA methyltransferase [Lysinibacillus sphaericus]MBG9692109.1 hypothetical protein [Lysinibacillus sphaericus]